MYNFIHTQVNTNGFISFDNPFTSHSPSPLPLGGTQQIIAPYWDNVDTRGTGEIFYRQTADPGLLAKTSNTIRGALPTLSQNAVITNLFIVTWDAVGYYPRGTDKVSWFILLLYRTVSY